MSTPYHEPGRAGRKQAPVWGAFPLPFDRSGPVHRIRFLSILIALVLLPASTPLRGQSPAESTELTIFLVTMDQGDEVWERFGHNAIWIHDPVRGTDLVYNYGVFDFNSPGYWGRFVKGNWIYQLAVSDIYDTMRMYQYFNRTVTAQELNLTPEQARELQEFLEWNRRPENAEYLYDYYRDNCSTRVRDVLDRVLGGALHRATAEVPTETSYRWHSHRLLQGAVAPYTGISLALGSDVDRPITRWEEMFLPGKLRERVRELRVGGPEGEAVPLVRSEQVLYEAVGRVAEATAPAPVLRWYLLAGIGIGILILVAARIGMVGGIVGAGGRVIFAILAGGWTFLIGSAGLLLTALWTLTNHTFSYYNENLFQATPLALPLIVLLPALTFGANWAGRPAFWLAAALALSSVAGAVLQLLPWFSQVNGDIIALVLPVHLALALAVYWLRRALYSPRAGTSSGWRESRRSIAGGR